MLVSLETGEDSGATFINSVLATLQISVNVFRLLSGMS